MITFKSHEDLNKLNRNDPAYPVIEDLAKALIDDFSTPDEPYNAEDYGFLVLIKPVDTDRKLSDIDMPWTLAEVPWERISRRVRDPDGEIHIRIHKNTGNGFFSPEWVSLKDIENVFAQMVNDQTMLMAEIPSDEFREGHPDIIYAHPYLSYHNPPLLSLEKHRSI